MHPFPETRLPENEVVDMVGIYSGWLFREMVSVLRPLEDQNRLIGCIRSMAVNLSTAFTYRYSQDNETAVIFSGKSGPLHERIFNSAFRKAQGNVPYLKRPNIISFDDWQNQTLYRPSWGTVPNFTNSPDPLDILRSLKQAGKILEIHEDHTRVGGKLEALAGLRRQGLLDMIFEYSSREYPNYFYDPHFYFGLRNDWFNGFMSGLSKLFSERQFLKLYHCLPIFDESNRLIPLIRLDVFDQAMDVLDKGLEALANGINK